MSDRTALYRHFDSTDALLYVGISLSAVHRLAQHKRSASWFKDIARVEVEWFSTRAEAIAAEREAICDEAPKHNIVGRTIDSPIEDMPVLTDANVIVGKCFVVFGPDRKPVRQGVVQGVVADDLFLVQWFDWITGEPSTLSVVPVTNMLWKNNGREKGEWEFFEDDAHLRFWLQYR